MIPKKQIKKQAKELYEKFNLVNTPSEMNIKGEINLTNLSYLASKECALIALDFFLDNEFCVIPRIHKEYFKEVRKEVEIL
jgi:hypothetical protein